MRRFLGLVVLVLFAMPFGLSVVGCGHKTSVQYCSANLEAGFQVGQVHNISLASNLVVSGESLNDGQIGSPLSASAVDCNGGAVSVTSYVYSSQDRSIADINPANGTVCAGTWNRNSGGGIADYTQCTPPAATNTNHVTYVYAQANGVTSNAIAVYIHAPVTGVRLGNPTPVAECGVAGSDPGTNCCVFNTTSSATSAVSVLNGYDENSCVSQGDARQLVARVYSGGIIDAAHNITCQVGPVNFALQGATSIATLDAQGNISANQPGSALITATVSNSSSALNSGFFSTCPPASIQLSAVNQPAGASKINVALNTPQSFSATVLDTNIDAAHPFGHNITGIALEFNSTLPVNFPTSGNAVTPAFPGTATITAVCNPGTCNPAPFSQIGYLGNGKPITSNGIAVTATGTSASVLYMASTPSTAAVNGSTVTNAGSQYIASIDFTTGQLGAPIKLPYVPNSMVISQDGSTLYLGSQQGLMIVATASNAVANTFAAVQGTVLAVAPNNAYAVVTDPNRQTVSLVTSSGTVFSTFNGVGTRAAWTPDSSTVYVLAQTSGASSGDATPNQLLTYTTFTGWESTNLLDRHYGDVAVTVPAVGAYFAGVNSAGESIVDGRSYCSNTTLDTTVTPDVAINSFFPLADSKQVPADRLTATTDGVHILGASASGRTLQDITLTDLPVVAACPQFPNLVSPGYFASSPVAHALPGITPAAVTGVVSASNSATAFVTYTGLGGILPLYQPATGLITNVPLSGGATAPVAGVFSSDDTTFYVGTSGDNQVHVIGVNGAATTDTGVITPNLQDPNGAVATPNLIAQRVRRTTS